MATDPGAGDLLGRGGGPRPGFPSRPTAPGGLLPLGHAAARRVERVGDLDPLAPHRTLATGLSVHRPADRTKASRVARLASHRRRATARSCHRPTELPPATGRLGSHYPEPDTAMDRHRLR